MHQYRRLLVWQRSRTFVRDVYLATQTVPNDERFGLTQQLRRAAVSIPSNIAEGAGRGSPGDFARFIRTAIGSACEAETQLDISLDLGLMDKKLHGQLVAELAELQKMLHGLERRIKHE
ncbi:MAG: four helix bundle protein [Rhodothermales bacterium]|nr:four helix bundle protein [Rhodothermales bacterium]